MRVLCTISPQVDVVVVFFLWIFFLQNICPVGETDESAATLKTMVTLVTSVENTMVTLGNANFGSGRAKKEDIDNIVGRRILHGFCGLLLANVVLLQEGARNLDLHLVSGSEEGAERGAARAEGTLLLEEKLLLPPLLFQPEL